jgi:hypothetical protein
MRLLLSRKAVPVSASNVGLPAVRHGKGGRRHDTIGRFGMTLGGKLAVTEVALMVTVREPGRNFPQVSPPDRLTAERTEGLRARCPVIDQNELHAATLT